MLSRVAFYPVAFFPNGVLSGIQIFIKKISFVFSSHFHVHIDDRFNTVTRRIEN